MLGGAEPDSRQVKQFSGQLVCIHILPMAVAATVVQRKCQTRLVGRCLFVILTPFCKIPAARCNFKILQTPPLAHLRNATGQAGCLKNAAAHFQFGLRRYMLIAGCTDEALV